MIMKKYFIGLVAIAIGIFASAYANPGTKKFDCGNPSDYWFIVPGAFSPTLLSGAITAVGTGSSGTPYNMIGTQNNFDAAGACGNQNSIIICAFCVPASKVSFQNGAFRLVTGVLDTDINCYERRHLVE